MPDPVRELRNELMTGGLLSDIKTDGIVPDLIVRSWRRSISVEVPRDVPTVRHVDVDPDSLLCRAAAPIFDHWQMQLADTGSALLLSDRGGSIVMRRATDLGVLRSLDRANAAEGFCYAEDSVGTNGIGTAIAERGPVFVEGSAHFNDILSGLTCAAVPVCAPGGVVIGAVSLSAARESADPLMLPLTREIGRQVEDRLRATSSPEDLALAMSFMRHANAERPIVVMDRQSLLVNTPGLPFVDVTSHVVLWDMLNEHDWSAGQFHLMSYGPSGVGVTARRLATGAGEHFVLQFHVPDLARPTRQPSTARRTARAARPVILVEGPPGSGRAFEARRQVVGQSVSEHSAADLGWGRIREELEESHVLIRRLEQVEAQEATVLARLIREHVRASRDGRQTHLILTVDRSLAHPEVLAALGDVSDSVLARPLSETPERIAGLVRDVLEAVDEQRGHSVSPAALQVLMQWNWPGNVSELVDVVTDLVRTVREPVIQRRHLPTYLSSAPPRRRMSMLESAERDAIVRALEAAHGNKSEAAELLGIGRTTLYRRLRHFRLDGREASL